MQSRMWWEEIPEGLVWAMASSARWIMNCAACVFIYLCKAYKTHFWAFQGKTLCRFHMYLESLSFPPPLLLQWVSLLFLLEHGSVEPTQITCWGIYLQWNVLGCFGLFGFFFFLPMETLLSADNVPFSRCCFFFDDERYFSQHFLTLYQLISGVIPHSKSRKPSALLKTVSSFRKMLCS